MRVAEWPGFYFAIDFNHDHTHIRVAAVLASYREGGSGGSEHLGLRLRPHKGRSGAWCATGLDGHARNQGTEPSSGRCCGGQRRSTPKHLSRSWPWPPKPGEPLTSGRGSSHLGRYRAVYPRVGLTANSGLLAPVMRSVVAESRGETRGASLGVCQNDAPAATARPKRHNGKAPLLQGSGAFSLCRHLKINKSLPYP